MAAGKLRERVRFDRRATVPDDGHGNEVGDWDLLAGPMSAEIKPLQMREDALAAKLEGRNIVEITVRWHSAVSGVTNADRVVDTRAGTVYNILGDENRDMRKRYLTILAEAGTVVG